MLFEMCDVCIWKVFTDDIDSNKFCLLLNESSGMSMINSLGDVSVTYFSHSSNKVESTYVGLTKCEKYDTSSIDTALQKLFVTES